MGFAIAILLTLALAGSVLWVMPSPREKRLTALRNSAMRAGMRVRLLDKKLAESLFPWLQDHRGYVLYELPSHNRQYQAAGIRVVRLNEGEAVHELDQDEAVVSYVKQSVFLDDLPACAEAIVFYPQSVAVLWRESEGQEADGVHAVLQACINQPLRAD